MRSARRLRLRFDERRGVLKLTCPSAPAAGRRWPGPPSSGPGSTPRSPTRCRASPLLPGATVPDRRAGHPAGLGARRSRAFRAWSKRSCAAAVPTSTFPRRVESFLRRRALDTLSRETAQIAAVAGISPRSVTRRRRQHPLGQLLGRTPDPLQLAADPRAAGRAPLRRRARSRPPRPSRPRARIPEAGGAPVGPAVQRRRGRGAGSIASRRAAAEADRARGLTAAAAVAAAARAAPAAPIAAAAGERARCRA